MSRSQPPFEEKEHNRNRTGTRGASFPSNSGEVSPSAAFGSHYSPFITGSPRQEHPPSLRSFSASTIEPEGSPGLSNVLSTERNDEKMADVRNFEIPLDSEPLAHHHHSQPPLGGGVPESQSLANLRTMDFHRGNYEAVSLSITAPSTSQTIPSRDGKLPNREYYPSRHHQAQFDALSLQESSFIQQRETVGLNSLNGDLDQPPLYAMPRIIECAIMGSPRQKLTLSELRVTLKRRFRYYEKEEARGVKSWERTLLQNLSKKERFLNAERAEPGQGGYWTINQSAPPVNRAPKRVSRARLPSGQNSSQGRESTSTICSPMDDFGVFGSPYDLFSPRCNLGGPSSLFPEVPTAMLPDGRLKGRHAYTIRLPQVLPSPQSAVSSSPRNWKISRVLNSSTINPRVSSQSPYPGAPRIRLPNIWS